MPTARADGAQVFDASRSEEMRHERSIRSESSLSRGGHRKVRGLGSDPPGP